jgi:Reverse transcriptase (RNA-dependent DNA polymerase)
MADRFNLFFTSVAQEISSSINPVFEEIVVQPPDNNVFSMSQVPISYDELTIAVSKLQDKKSLDKNNISMFLLKKVLTSISNPIIHVFNKSLQLGTVPRSLKIAKVVPIYKSGDVQDMNNYRPISLLCSFSKILEKIVFLRFMCYLEDNNILSCKQYGFRPKHSTYHPMLNLTNKAFSALNSKKHMLIIFCDLKKAFDTCNVNILLKKLQKVGVFGIELEWFKSYLTDRWQYVTLNNFDSILLRILTGVPQGSILGPLLFLIYINDMPECCDLDFNLFADDTALISEDDDIDNLFRKTNHEFQKVCAYFRLHKLSLHPDKTKYILISNSRNVNEIASKIFINNNNPDQNDPKNIHEILRVRTTDKVPAIKYLGVYFDPGLTFTYHVEQISHKISRALFFLRRVKNILSTAALRTLYFSLVHCHLIYAIEIWSLTAQRNLNELFIKQKMAIRIISNSKYNSHTAPLFKMLKILPLESLAKVSLLKVMHYYVRDMMPTSFNSTWSTNRARLENIGASGLRNEDDFRIPYARTNHLIRFPIVCCPTLWNNLPFETKIITSPLTFILTVKSSLLELLPNVPECTRLFCPVCSV